MSEAEKFVQEALMEQRGLVLDRFSSLKPALSYLFT